MEFEQAKQIVNKNRDKELTDQQIKEVLLLAEMLASCTINHLKTASLK
jgi:hypothetical protein